MSDAKIYASNTNNFEFLDYYLDTKITEICTTMCLDVSALKAKDNRINALRTLPYIYLDDPAQNRTNVSNYNFKLRNFHTLTEKDDIFSYLELFEENARHQNIPPEQFGIILSGFLTGLAQTTWTEMDSSLKADWNIVKSTLLQAYNLTQDAYRAKFNSTLKSHQQSFMEYGNKILLHLKRWLEPSESLLRTPEFKSLLDKLVINRVLEQISDTNLKIRLTECELSLQEAMKMCDDFARQSKSESHGNDRERIVCNYCKKRGHTKADCDALKAKGQGSNSRSGSPSREDQKHDLKPGNSPLHKVKPGGKTFCISLATGTDMLLNASDMHVTDGPYIASRLNDMPYFAHVDSGSSHSIISHDVALNLGLVVSETKEQLRAANGNLLQVYGTTSIYFSLSTEKCTHDFVVADISCPLIMGRDLMVKCRLSINLAAKEFWTGNSSGAPVIKHPLIFSYPFCVSDTVVSVTTSVPCDTSGQSSNCVVESKLISEKSKTESDNIDTAVSDSCLVLNSPLLFESGNCGFVKPVVSVSNSCFEEPVQMLSESGNCIPPDVSVTNSCSGRPSQMLFESDSTETSVSVGFQPNSSPDILDTDIPDLDPHLFEIFTGHSNVFSERTGCSNLLYHDIITSDEKPVFCKPCRLGPQVLSDLELRSRSLIPNSVDFIESQTADVEISPIMDFLKLHEVPWTDPANFDLSPKLQLVMASDENSNISNTCIYPTGKG